ncbi:hypothetical protein MTBGP_16960 [Moorella thermoacetica]
MSLVAINTIILLWGGGGGYFTSTSRRYNFLVPSLKYHPLLFIPPGYSCSLPGRAPVFSCAFPGFNFTCLLRSPPDVGRNNVGDQPLMITGK